MNRKTLEHWGFWCAIGAAFGVSAKAIFVKLAYLVPQEIPANAILLLTLRMLFSAPFFLYFAYRLKHSKTHKHVPSLTFLEWLWLIILGMLGYYFSSYWDFLSLNYISAALERLILMTYPSITVLLGVLFFKKHFSLKEALAMFLMYFGIFIAFWSDLKITNHSQKIYWGAFLVFSASLTYAIYLLGASRFIQKMGSTRFTLYSMASATLGILLHYVLTQPLVLLFEQSYWVYLYSFAMALISTVIPVFLLGLAIRFIGAARASMLGMLGPIITIFLGAWVLNERFSIWQILGALFLISGVVLLSNILDSLKHFLMIKKTK